MEGFWSFDLAPWRLAAVAAALLLAVTLAIRQVRRDRVRRGIRWTEALRAAAVAAFALTLLRPERVHVVKRERKPGIVVLADRSGSMATKDVAVSTGGVAGVLAREAWLAEQRARRFWTPLESLYEVQTADFAAPPKGEGASPDPGTDINAALDRAVTLHGNLRAVVLLTDGDWNEGLSPVGAATRLRAREAPVFCVAVGSEKHLPDLELQAVAVPAYGLVDEQINLPFTVQSRIPREIRATVELEGGAGVVARREIVVPPMAQAQASVVWVPSAEGDQALKLRLPADPEEIRRDNNERAFHIAVRREVLRVLLIDSAPRWEYRYLRNALVRDPGADVDCLLLHPGLGPGGGRFYLSAFPGTRDALSKYDVVFLGDVGMGPEGLTEEQVRQIRGLVEQQASGLVFLPGPMGRQFSLLTSPLADLMPVVLDESAPGGYGFSLESRLALTTRGRGHLLTLLAGTAEQNESVWRGLPGFFWYAPVVRAKPGGDVLAVHSDARNVSGRIPLLVARAAGNGKVLFMGTDSAWRWRRGVEDFYHYRFWGQVVRWMAHQRHLAHTEGIRFFFVPEAPNRGDRVFLHATAFDAGGAPLDQARVQVQLRTPGGASQIVDLLPDPGGWGVSGGSFVATEGGEYAAEVVCLDTGRRVTAAIPVHQPRREQTGRPARAEVLREVANITGGLCVGPPDLDRLIEAVRVLPDRRPEERRFRLWCHPLWAALVVGLLAAYWVARKWQGQI